MFKSFKYAFKGLKVLLLEEANFRLEIAATAAVLAFAVYNDFSYVELAWVVLAAVLVLVAEVINSLIERILNMIEPGYNPLVGKFKDISAAIVLIHVVGACAIGILVLLNHFG